MLIALSIINIVLIAYLFLISLRIVLGWFAPQALGRAWDLLTAVTDPYLRLFRRIGFLRGGMFDFSPIAAVLALVVALELVNQLLYYGRITLGFILASIFSAGWSGARFLLLLFLVIGIIRAIPLATRSPSASGLLRVVDMIVQPVVAWVAGILRLGRKSTYPQQLLITLGLLLAAWLMGELLVRELTILFQMLPV